MLIFCLLQDVEMNRPGKTGFRVRKKKTDAAEVRTL